MASNTILDQQSIPGTILKDMNTFLDFIQEHPLEITGKKGLLPNHCLASINIKMSHPLKLALKREQQISYPHISGLYLLSRSLGFIQLTRHQSKRLLTINPEMMAQWHQLNDVEKYFGLMQAWFFRCDERLINQGRYQLFTCTLDSIMSFIQHRLKKAIQFKDKKDQSSKMYAISLYNLALLEMFGLVNITDNDSSIEKSWVIAKIQMSDFGAQWLALLKKINYNQLILLMDNDNIEAMQKFHQQLAPFAPQWKNCIELTQKITNQNVHIFKVSLAKNIWRKLRIPGTATLAALSELILEAFDFNNDHLHRFTYIDRYGALQCINHYHCEAHPYSDEVDVGDMDILTGDSIEFLFDFGDRWIFDVQLIQIEEALSNNTKASIIESNGDVPQQYAHEDDFY